MSTGTFSTTDAKMERPDSSAARPTGDRRSRPRAKISARVRVRIVNSPTAFEEVCNTVDVSRDGVLFLSSHSGYSPSQQLEVTFPYSTAASALNQPQAAEVVRVVEHGNGLFGIGVQFAAAKAPAGDAKANSGAAPDPHAGASLVLAIEPNRRDADMMRGVLQQDGYKVVIVPTAQEALEVLKTAVPAAFITEIENPDMSGHDLCLIIKRDDRLQRVPVILLTRSARPQDYSASHQLGAVICMAKPFNPDRLQQVIRLVAPRPAQRSAYGARVQSGAIERSL
ncbi:MAG TPA: response regulator [Candidatus Cybelea sp.]|nr:response regulator [Candidatus Cybelea sp.]